MRIRRKKRDRYDISVIPMIDVFMVLLIFFMITTTFNRQAALKINLPEAHGAAEEAPPQSVTLSIDQSGYYYLLEEEGKYRKLRDQERDTLTLELNKLTLQAKNVPFIIEADSKTQHQAVMTALDAAGLAGFTHITFAAQDSGNGEE